jgi:mannopine transport system ATP-binding protein
MTIEIMQREQMVAAAWQQSDVSGHEKAARDTGATVSIRDLEKAYGSVGAVCRVNLDIKGGEFISLLGPSGSGKTTILMMLAGFVTPDAGSIHMAERDVTVVPANRRNVGMVFQRYALFPNMTVFENIAFPLKMRRISRRDIVERVEETLALVKLTGYGERRPSQLSGGQQQRVALARAIVFRPPVLLMDEPLAALDKKLRQAMQIELKRLQEALGSTVIYVTHDQEEALTMSDRVAVLNHGRLEQIASPEQLYRRPANNFVADFIGKMNFLEGEYLGSDGKHATVQLSPVAKVTVTNDPDDFGSGLPHHRQLRIAVRPEHLRLAPRGEGGDHAIPVRLETTIFVGSFHICLVSIVGRDDSPLQVQIPASGSALQFRAGDPADLIVDEDAARIFPAARS